MFNTLIKLLKIPNSISGSALIGLTIQLDKWDACIKTKIQNNM